MNVSDKNQKKIKDSKKWLESRIGFNFWFKKNWKKFILLLIAIILIGGAGAALTINETGFFKKSSFSHYYYLAPWEWFQESSDLSYWRCPGEDCRESIDLRSIPQMSRLGGIPEGYGFFVYDKEKNISDSIFLGNDLKGTLQNKAKLQTALGKILDSTTLLDILWELLTSEADPGGQTFAKPIMPTAIGNLELYLGGSSPVKSEQFNPLEHTFVLEVVRESYRTVRQETLEGLHPKEFHRRYLQALVEKYKVPWQDLIPKDLAKESPLPHSTIITEDFNTTDSDTLGPDLSWTELQDDIDVVSNTARTTSVNYSSARANSDLSTDDHYVQADVLISGGAADRYLGVFVRKDSSSTLTYYRAVLEMWSDDLRLEKVIGNVGTILATPDYALTEGIVYNDKLAVNGSTLEFFLDGVSQYTVTDTAITGNLRTGIWGRNKSGGGQYAQWDNFEAGDIPNPSIILNSDVIFNGDVIFR